MKKFINSFVLILIFATQVFACDVDLYFSPVDDVEDVILSELSAAKKTVQVAAYGIASPVIAAKLIDLKKAGLDVTVYLDRTQAAGRGSQCAALRKAGVRVLIKRSSYLMHNKYIVVDGRTVITGSYNFSKGAARQDNNIEVFHDCSGVAAGFDKDFGRMTGR